MFIEIINLKLSILCPKGRKIDKIYIYITRNIIHLQCRFHQQTMPPKSKKKRKRKQIIWTLHMDVWDIICFLFLFFFDIDDKSIKLLIERVNHIIKCDIRNNLSKHRHLYPDNTDDEIIRRLLEWNRLNKHQVQIIINGGHPNYKIGSHKSIYKSDTILVIRAGY
jgi:hypothetical protein